MHPLIILAVMIVTTFFPFFAEAENSMPVGGQLMPLGPVDLTRSSGSNSVVPAPTLAPGLTKPQTHFRSVPSISGDYSVAGTTLMPYVGVGFNNGYTTDMDRSLHLSPSNTSDAGLSGILGQNLVPNEFQWGVRIPF